MMSKFDVLASSGVCMFVGCVLLIHTVLFPSTFLTGKMHQCWFMGLKELIQHSR